MASRNTMNCCNFVKILWEMKCSNLLNLENTIFKDFEKIKTSLEKCFDPSFASFDIDSATKDFNSSPGQTMPIWIILLYSLGFVLIGIHLGTHFLYVHETWKIMRDRQNKKEKEDNDQE